MHLASSSQNVTSKLEFNNIDLKHKVQMTNTKDNYYLKCRIIKWETTFYYTGCQALTRNYQYSV
jgi:hypothetical protein